MLLPPTRDRNEEPVMRNHRIVFGITFLLAAGARGDEPATLKGFDGWVGAVAFSPDSRKLAVGVSDGGVSIWDANRGEKVDATPGLRSVSSLAFTADGAT